MRRTITVAVAGLAAAVGLAACGSDSGGSGSGGKGTIGVSVPTVEGPFFTAMLYGITDEAKKLGYKVEIMDAGGYPNVDQQSSQMNTLATKQVKAILVDPADPTTIKSAVTQAQSQNVFVVGTGDPAPEAKSNVSSSHCNVGHAMAKGAKELLPKGGTVGVLAGPPGATWSTARLKCFKQDLAGGNIKIVAEKTSDPAVDEGVTIASDFLQRFPTLSLLYGADDTVGVGAAKAVQSAKHCGKTKVLTAVLGEQAEQLMKQGCVNYDVGQQTVLIGREGVRIADKLIKGQSVPQNNEVPLVPVTEKNVNQVNLATMRQPAGYHP
jgi:ABC-type sugar transport system substrate-binding protein